MVLTADSINRVHTVECVGIIDEANTVGDLRVIDEDTNTTTHINLAANTNISAGRERGEVGQVNIFLITTATTTNNNNNYYHYYTPTHIS